jgi:hypothetical protein
VIRDRRANGDACCERMCLTHVCVRESGDGEEKQQHQSSSSSLVGGSLFACCLLLSLVTLKSFASKLSLRSQSRIKGASSSRSLVSFGAF